MAKRTLEDSVDEGNQLSGKKENSKKTELRPLPPWH